MLDSWTWDVTGETYQYVAEVSYSQEFAEQTVEDVVRLVFHDQTWRWFFGRSKEFVDEQNLRFSQKDHLEPEGMAPFGLEAMTLLLWT